jgi:hypothetical protein
MRSCHQYTLPSVDFYNTYSVAILKEPVYVVVGKSARKQKITLVKMVNVQELWRTFVFSDLIWSYYSLVYFGYYAFDVEITTGEVGELFVKESVLER